MVVVPSAHDRSSDCQNDTHDAWGPGIRPYSRHHWVEHTRSISMTNGSHRGYVRRYGDDQSMFTWPDSVAIEKN
jgi:hypothetical protein